MRTVMIVVVQIVFSLVVTATVMPLVLVTTPAAQTDARLGIGLVIGIVIVSFTLISLVWPRKRS